MKKHNDVVIRKYSTQLFYFLTILLLLLFVLTLVWIYNNLEEVEGFLLEDNLLSISLGIPVSISLTAILIQFLLKERIENIKSERINSLILNDVLFTDKTTEKVTSKTSNAPNITKYLKRIKELEVELATLAGVKKERDDLKQEILSYRLIKNSIYRSVFNSRRVYRSCFLYLLLGISMVIAGVSVFVAPIFPSYEPELRFIDNVFIYIPRFGVLFFIEFIAFYFLKQYRLNMEDYRYYESVIRNMEESLFLYNIIGVYKDDVELVKVICNARRSHIYDTTSKDTELSNDFKKAILADQDLVDKLINITKMFE